mmetsp:Transcript_15413/g.37878  ORF Transcript_15413/g.37878 Transcript_15413/m.37878 type:complete len:426 (+) Transcript_15413:2235-3512(+)
MCHRDYREVGEDWRQRTRAPPARVTPVPPEPTEEQGPGYRPRGAAERPRPPDPHHWARDKALPPASLPSPDPPPRAVDGSEVEREARGGQGPGDPGGAGPLPAQDQPDQTPRQDGGREEERADDHEGLARAAQCRRRWAGCPGAGGGEEARPRWAGVRQSDPGDRRSLPPALDGRVPRRILLDRRHERPDAHPRGAHDGRTTHTRDAERHLRLPVARAQVRGVPAPHRPDAAQRDPHRAGRPEHRAPEGGAHAAAGAREHRGQGHEAVPRGHLQGDLREVDEGAELRRSSGGGGARAHREDQPRPQRRIQVLPARAHPALPPGSPRHGASPGARQLAADGREAVHSAEAELVQADDPCELEDPLRPGPAHPHDDPNVRVQPGGLPPSPDPHADATRRVDGDGFFELLRRERRRDDREALDEARLS